MRCNGFIFDDILINKAEAWMTTGRVFSPKDMHMFLETIGIPKISGYRGGFNIINSLLRSGRIERIRRGLYCNMLIVEPLMLEAIRLNDGGVPTWSEIAEAMWPTSGEPAA